MTKSKNLWCAGRTEDHGLGAIEFAYLTEGNKLLVFTSFEEARTWVQEKNTAYEQACRVWEAARKQAWDKEQAEAEELYTKRKQALQDAGLWPDADADDPLREGTAYNRSVLFPGKPERWETHQPVPYNESFLDLYDITAEDLVDVHGNTVTVDCDCVACLAAEADQETTVEQKIAVFSDRIRCGRCGGTGCAHAKNHENDCWTDTLKS